MSHPIGPPARSEEPAESGQSSFSSAKYQEYRSADADDRTTDLRAADDMMARAEFDQDFDDQDRLRSQTGAVPAAYRGDRSTDPTVRTEPRYGDSTSDGGPSANDPTVRTDPSRSDPAGTTARYATAGAHPVADETTERAMPATVLPDRQTVAAREKEHFGGMSFGSGFFGWLTATGMAVLLITIVAAAGVALGVTSNDVVQESQTDTGSAQTVGLVGAILLLVILLIAYYCGGYVAGRMARFSGAKQGLAVWLWALITTAVIAAVGAIAGSQYNVLAQLNLPRIPVDEGSVTTVGLIAIGAAVLVALIGAVLGGIAGTRFHRKVDAVGFQEDGRIS
ncbi:hypothetical protein ACVBEQ_19570 [Nakamurella sp. GG22]